jgi:hypothetical protein
MREHEENEGETRACVCVCVCVNGRDREAGEDLRVGPERKEGEGEIGPTL